MNGWWYVIVSNLIILVAILGAFPSFAQDYVPGEVIVRLKGTSDSQQSYSFWVRPTLIKR